MGEVRLRWTGERLQFLGEPGYGNAVPIGGDIDGPGSKPADLLPLSLAACTAYDVVEILRKQRQDIRGLEAVITSMQDEDPPWTFRARPSVPSRSRRASTARLRRPCGMSWTFPTRCASSPPDSLRRHGRLRRALVAR